MSSWYSDLSERVDTRPDFSRDWKWLLAISLLVYLICLGVRVMELPQWDHPGLWAAGERIQSTHDAYYWMAGAQGIRAVSYSQLANLTKFLAEDMGFGYSAVAFWGPVFISGLTGVVVCLWGWLLAGRTGGLAAGVLAGLAKGFYVRTRFGYYDSDMFTLLGPVAAGLLVAILLRPYLRVGGADEPPAATDMGLLKQFGLAMVLGLFARTCWWWHQDVYTLLMGFFWISLFLVAVWGRRGRRGEGFAVLALFWIMVFGNSGIWEALTSRYEMYLLGGSLALVAGFWAQRRRRAESMPELALGLGALLLLVVGENLMTTPLRMAWAQIAPYLMPASGTTMAAGTAVSQAVDPVSYPAVTQSIIEAATTGWGELFVRLSPVSWLAPVGILGFVVVCVLRPSALFLLPLLAVGLASKKMGVRFTMFALPAVGLGLSVPLAWGVRSFVGERFRRYAAWGSQGALALVLVVAAVVQYWDYPLTPVLSKPDIEALAELKKISEPGSVAWTWWDWGYATQHYAERFTPADGGTHAGRDVYPLALALSTDSFRQAANVIRYSADHDLHPAKEWDAMGGKKAMALLESFRDMDYRPTGNIPDQYLVATWANVRVLGWITTFGGWDLVRGNTGKGVLTPLRGHPFRLDPARGAVVFETGDRPPLPVSSVDLLDGKGFKHEDFFMNTGPHLVINAGQKDAYLMDDKAYYSMLVQLLVADPKSKPVSDNFELVHEGSPHVRIYKVR